jgi:hypothetical protein
VGGATVAGLQFEFDPFTIGQTLLSTLLLPDAIAAKGVLPILFKGEKI